MRAIALLVPVVLAGLIAANVLVGWAGSDPQGLAIELVLCVAAGASGRWPTTSGVASGVLLSLLVVVTTVEARFAAFACVIPLAAAAARGRWPLAGGLCVWYLGALTALEMSTPALRDQPVAAITGWALVCGLALSVGALLDMQRRRWRNADLARRAALQAQRRAIARDLHDTVAHATTLLVMRAEQAKLRAGDADRIREDLDFIVTSGQEALRDLRSMLGAMRSAEPEELPVQRTLPVEAALDQWTDTLTRAGFRPTVFVSVDLERLPATVRATIAAALQETVSNVVRHGKPGTECSIMLEQANDEVGLIVVNVIGDRSFSYGSQIGLVGLSERVRAVGGAMEAMTTPPRWIVHVRLPLGTERRLLSHDLPVEAKG